VGVSAVVCTNDVFAVGAMMACRERQLRIPQEISITGVDNTDLGATQTPALTSIRTPIVEIGRAAAEQLIARLEGRPYVPFETLPFDLVLRGSTGAPPATNGAAPAKSRSRTTAARR
jgi:LacI family transcriptional regulator